MSQLRIEDRRGKLLTTLTLAADATTDDLKKAFAKECEKEQADTWQTGGRGQTDSCLTQPTVRRCCYWVTRCCIHPLTRPALLYVPLSLLFSQSPAGT